MGLFEELTLFSSSFCRPPGACIDRSSMLALAGMLLGWLGESGFGFTTLKVYTIVIIYSIRIVSTASLSAETTGASFLLPQVKQNYAFVSCSLITMKKVSSWTRAEEPAKNLQKIANFANSAIHLQCGWRQREAWPLPQRPERWGTRWTVKLTPRSTRSFLRRLASCIRRAVLFRISRNFCKQS